MILLQRPWHRWRFTLAALAWIALVMAVVGPEQALPRHVFVPQHFWQYVALHFGFGPLGTRITVGQFIHDLVATQIWLSVPAVCWPPACRCGTPSGPPAGPSGKGMAVVGAPGAGKTVTLLRLAYLAGVLGRKVCFVDCKARTPTLVPALIAAYRLGNPTARIACWGPVPASRTTSPDVVGLAVAASVQPVADGLARGGLRRATPHRAAFRGVSRGPGTGS